MRDAWLQTLTFIADNLIKYRSVPGSDEQQIEIEWRAAITKAEREKTRKRAVQKGPTGWVQEITLRDSFCAESS